jgi:hypothetical protein
MMLNSYSAQTAISSKFWAMSLNTFPNNGTTSPNNCHLIKCTSTPQESQEDRHCGTVKICRIIQIVSAHCSRGETSQFMACQAIHYQAQMFSTIAARLPFLLEVSCLLNGILPHSLITSWWYEANTYGLKQESINQKPRDRPTHSLSPRTIGVPPYSGRRTLSPSLTLTGMIPPSLVRAPVPVAITTPEFN